MKEFIAANERSPVVEGNLTGPDGAYTGVAYTLDDGSYFRLASDDVRSAPDYNPVWKLPAA